MDALEAFKCLHEKLTQASILAFPQSGPGVPFTLVTDISLKHGYGGMLDPISKWKKSCDRLFFPRILGPQKELHSILPGTGRCHCHN